MAASLTQALGAFVAELRSEAVPEDARAVARTGFIDCLGVMLAGASEPVVGILREVVGTGGEAEASILLGPERAAAPNAAWINATAAHALDYDDVAQRGHPSTVLVPAVLAEGEALDVDGAALLTAYVAGYEVWAELVRHDGGYHHEKGWHPTGIFGAIGAAAACAKLHRLDAEKAAMAIALAASQASGVVANFGSMTKPFHAGRAAHSGIISARLARAGMTASPDTIEHPRGFLRAISPEGKLDDLTPSEGFGRDWRIITGRLSIKKYPMCYFAHRAADAMIDLVKSERPDPRAIERIEVSVSRSHAAVLRNAQPNTGLEAKFSAQFAMAAALTTGWIGLRELTDSYVQRPEIQDLMRRVIVVPSDDIDPALPGYARADSVRIFMKDGRRIDSVPVRRARGHAEAPLREDELRAKFEDCLASADAGAHAAPLYQKLRHLEALPSARALSTSREPARDASSAV
ncbi:MmgE/PrpD family protein [Roseomonas chloroacetimidivorans]|uniref:MmgE/PrpD family protein n=1 Tax=Roseomonas chloroacetimidivorans TaxID=1766656 RepID=UPI003C7838CD